MAEKLYQPTISNRFFPGRISEARKKQISNFEITIDELSTDDILWGANRNITGVLYGMFEVVKQRWGEKAAIEVASDYVANRARGGFKKFLKDRGKTQGSPSLMAEYQDFVHALQGPNPSSAFSQYDDEKCIVSRKGCTYHTDRPEGMVSLCKYLGDSFIQGYMEADPALLGSEKLKCLAFDNDCCSRIFWYKNYKKK
jgi:hypothetical protein